jgi:hypothetical protein
LPVAHDKGSIGDAPRIDLSQIQTTNSKNALKSIADHVNR